MLGAEMIDASDAELGMENVLHLERLCFGAKVRIARAVLNLSQRDLGKAVGLTQKSVHRIEHGSVDPSLRTIVRIQHFWQEAGIHFEELPDGGFRLIVRASVLKNIKTD